MAKGFFDDIIKNLEKVVKNHKIKCDNCGSTLDVELRCKKEISLQEKIIADVDDEIYFLMKRIQLKHDLSWPNARDAVNGAVLALKNNKNN